jgi:exonuclease SbcC
MEFEIKDLEIIDSNTAVLKNDPTHSLQSHIPNSVILSELAKENEELQNKLKLNYRRLLLFESENNKLLEEKNKLYFENKHFSETNQLLQEKNEELIKQNAMADSTQKLLIEKASSLESINKTQLSEIKRFTKFHDKIQEVVKPLVAKLKFQISELKIELAKQNRINTNLNAAYIELRQNREIEIQRKTQEVSSLKKEKTELVNTYEEQIHSFSKEILELQSRNQDLEKEITRLKKSVEFKNYFENEVVRFKRTHEEDQRMINELMKKNSELEANAISYAQTRQENTAEITLVKNRLSDAQDNLESTRIQLSKKIDELTQTFERMARLEKLNNQLSKELSAK